MSLEDSGEAAAPAASLIEISRVLEETARIVRQHAGGGAEPPRPPPVGASVVRRIIAARRLRGEMLGVPPADPAWAMMLELYAARLEGRHMSQTMLAAAAGVPETTGLRTTQKLLDRGLIDRRRTDEDKRLLLIRLSETAALRMEAYVATALAAGAMVA